VSTIEALMLGLRERGVAALAEPAVRQRLRQLDRKQAAEVGDRLQGLARYGVKPWSAEDVRQMIKTWRGLRR
jgi:hypothetical protein